MDTKGCHLAGYESGWALCWTLLEFELLQIVLSKWVILTWTVSRSLKLTTSWRLRLLSSKKLLKEKLFYEVPNMWKSNWSLCSMLAPNVIPIRMNGTLAVPRGRGGLMRFLNVLLSKFCTPCILSCTSNKIVGIYSCPILNSPLDSLKFKSL